MYSLRIVVSAAYCTPCRLDFVNAFSVGLYVGLPSNVVERVLRCVLVSLLKILILHGKGNEQNLVAFGSDRAHSKCHESCFPIEACIHHVSC